MRSWIVIGDQPQVAVSHFKPMRWQIHVSGDQRCAAKAAPCTRFWKVLGSAARTRPRLLLRRKLVCSIFDPFCIKSGATDSDVRHEEQKHIINS